VLSMVVIGKEGRHPDEFWFQIFQGVGKTEPFRWRSSSIERREKGKAHKGKNPAFIRSHKKGEITPRSSPVVLGEKKRKRVEDASKKASAISCIRPKKTGEPGPIKRTLRRGHFWKVVEPQEGGYLPHRRR